MEKLQDMSKLLSKSQNERKTGPVETKVITPGKIVPYECCLPPYIWAARWLSGQHCGLIARRSWVWFPAGAGPFYVDFACSFHVHVGFFSRCSGLPHHQNMCVGLFPVSTLDRGTGSESGVGSRALRCGCPLLLRDGLNVQNTFYWTLYMWAIKYLHLY